ncbi:CREB3 regulatory factor isoform X5 [Phalacrocorax carbo]|uniref:CREB3 regulatory factor isoform X5 n=1 Tax=Phalacrocorax carbo TaxID=9209 RepID=UPI003119E249
MPQPSVSGMDPPFGDAFRSHVFSEQTLMSTDLLASSSDPDFMYELDREMDYQQSSRDNLLSMEDCKDLENLESFTDILDKEAALTSKWEQWDTYCEDLTKYTKLTSCDIWGTKEVDYLGLDDFSSPYQDEEVISKTPTLAQLNSEDSQPVSDSLYYPDLLFGVKQNPLNSLLPSKKIATRAAAPVCTSKNVQAEAPLLDCVQKASKPAAQPASSTQIRVKTNVYNNEKVNIHVECKDYVKKAKVKINPLPQSRPVLNQTHADAAKENTCYCGAVAKRQERKGIESPHSHNSLGEQSAKGDPEEDEDDEDDIEDEDHDEGFGSEHELSENDDEEEDYEDDKDDDISDTFSEPAVTLSGSSKDTEFLSSACRNGALTTEIRTNLHLEGYENDSVEDLKEITAISSRKRSKRRYFWEYSEQLTPSQQERMLRPSEWNRDTLPSNMYQKNGLHHGKYAAKKSRRTDVEDLTPNPRKLLQIGNELRKLNKVISDLTPVSELPLTARPRSRKEKNKLASRACRLKKKAQYEANKVKLWGLNTEYDNLLFVINSIKQEIVNRVQVPKDDRGANMEQKLNVLIKDTLGLPVAGQTSEFVNQVLEKTAEGDPTGGLVGLRIPMSKV